MNVSQSFKAAIVGILFLGLVAVGPAPASAGNMWFQQALFLAHIPLGGGQFFTTNYVFAANEGAASINVKCFNDGFQRIGPLAGVNIALSATGQLANHTPTTLGVASDPLFSSGVGWCWASIIQSGLDFNTQITVGVTTDLTPNGILNSASSTFIGASTGLGESSANISGVPFFTTSGGAQAFLVLVNALTTTRTLTLTLFDANGIPQGPPLVRSLNGRALLALSVPSAFGVPTPPTSGSIKITMNAPNGQGYLGYFLQVYPNGRNIFTALGLDGDDTAQLPWAGAP